MPQPSQTNLSGALINTNELPVSAESAALDSAGKEGVGASPHEPRNSPDQNTEERTEHFLQLIASLESCNAALCNKLAQVEWELATLRKPALPETELAGHHEQSYGWERKLTRTGWRPS